MQLRHRKRKRMTSITSVSRAELTQRRRQLRQKRRVRHLQSLWRILAIGSLAGGLIWGVTLPGWMIRQPDQVEIQGNQFLSTQAIFALLSLSYPQSLLKVKPQALVEKLESSAPIASATVTRQLFPPRLTIYVRERQPVAVALANPTAAKFSKVGLLDANGVWMPLDSYTSLDRSLKLPTLKVAGMREEYAAQWPSLYQEISQSPVKIAEIDLQNPANLILKTDIGVFYLGPYSAKLPTQLDAIDRMRKLPQQFNPKQIAYIDLQTPELPTIQTVKTPEPIKSRTGN